MQADWLLFGLFGGVSLLSAIGVVTIQNAVKCAMSLIVCFFGLAALFVLQSAELLAVLEVLVYAGAVMVLFVFVIMLVENKDEESARTVLGSKWTLPVKLAGVGLVAFALGRAVRGAQFGERAALPEGFGGVASVGRTFLRDHLLHFELTSLLLLIGIVGAVIVARRGRRQEEPEGS
ncbi:MAG TPA: NADH-quinone oxidoreductase subunit J [Myxococcales bacterium LLY-WYZ-16_1]|nr:NADH-quinone oxidoreductase subunit J [Myxococcales bacterium LLY-WYZ-16_1]